MRNRFFLLYSLLAGTLAPTVRAEIPPEMASPTLGYVFDAVAQRLRPLAGIPGAAMVTAPVGDLAIRQAIPPPSPGWALAVDAERGAPGILRRAPNSFHPLPGISRAERLYLSPLGKSALALLSDTRVQRVSGLPDSPQVSRAFTLPDDVITTHLAISDDGSEILAALEGGGLLRIATADGTSRLIPTDGLVRALAFAPGRIDSIYADSVQVAVLRGLERQFVSPLRDDDGPAVAVAVAHGDRVITAFEKGLIRITSLPGNSTVDLHCACEPTGFHLLSEQEALFRLEEFRGQALRLLEASGAEPRVWFVPVQPEVGQ